MKHILLTVSLILPMVGIAQDCPTGNGDNIGAAVSNGTNHQIYLEWSTEADATAMYDALQGGALQTAVSLNGFVNQGAANEEAVSINLSKSELLQPVGNPFRIRSNIPVTSNYNGTFTGTITFNLNSGAGGGNTVCTYAVGILPVELTYFTATRFNKEVILQWQTASEINNDYMAVERSEDGRVFNEIGRLAGAGYSESSLNYELIDQIPLPGYSYYRLRQVDFDGTISYSEMLNVQFSDQGGVFRVYPTIIEGEAILNIQINTKNDSPLDVKLFNLNGQLINNYPLDGNGVHQIDLSSLAKGMYFLKGTGHNAHQSIRLIKAQ